MGDQRHAVKIDDDLWRRIEAIAVQQDRPVARVLRQLLSGALAQRLAALEGEAGHVQA